MRENSADDFARLILMILRCTLHDVSNSPPDKAAPSANLWPSTLQPRIAKIKSRIQRLIDDVVGCFIHVHAML